MNDTYRKLFEVFEKYSNHTFISKLNEETEQDHYVRIVDEVLSRMDENQRKYITEVFLEKKKETPWKEFFINDSTFFRFKKNSADTFFKKYNELMSLYKKRDNKKIY